MSIVFSRLQYTKLKRALEVVPNVYQLTIRGVNIILIVGEELTLIDTGFRGSSTPIAEFIHKLGRSVEEISLIIITHRHFDHAGGLADLRGLTRAKVAAHKADIGGIEKYLPYPAVVKKIMRIPPFSVLHSIYSLRAGEVDIRLEGGEVMGPLGGLQVIPTPGHTPGSISLFSPRHRLLIVGDALNKGGRMLRLPPRLVSTDQAQAAASVRRLAELEFDIICFGHGRPLTVDARSKMERLLEKIKY